MSVQATHLVQILAAGCIPSLYPKLKPDGISKQPHLVQVLAAGCVQCILKHLHLVDDRQVLVVWRHAQHKTVLPVQLHLARLTVLPGMQAEDSNMFHGRF